jgi:DNA-binding MarR family transcriptional regulator
MWEVDFQKFIADYFSSAKLKNQRFSQRSLAKKLQISSSTLSDLISGKRHVSATKAMKILAQLNDVDDIRKSALEDRIQACNDRRFLLDNENYDLILDWLFLGILCVLELDSPPRTAAAIAQSLGVQRDRLDAALDRLLEVGLIHRTAEGYSLEKVYFETTDGIPDSRIVKSHLDGMEKAADVLRNIGPDSRDFISLVTAGDSRKLRAAKALVRRFLQQLSRTLTGTKRDEVYKVNIQIFPLTRQDWRKNEP